MATVSVPSFEKGSPTLYNVIVSVQGQTQQLQKRYNEFVTLAHEVEQETGSPVPVQPPPKAWFLDDAALEERRRGLEAMIRALARSDECFATLAAQSFLEMSRLRRNQASTGGAADWTATIEKINEVLAQAKTSDSIRQHKLCLNAQTMLAGIQKLNQQSGVVGAREKVRRQQIIDELHQKITAIRSDVPSQPRSSPVLGGGSFRQSSEPRTGRVLGETSVTRSLDNQQLLTHQKRTIQDQDAEVQQLRDAIGRQKQLGLAINDEIVKQNSMLDDLDADVHRVNTKLNQAQRKTSKFL